METNVPVTRSQMRTCEDDEPMETNFSNHMFSSEIIILHMGFQLEKNQWKSSSRHDHDSTMTTCDVLKPRPFRPGDRRSRGDGDHGPMTMQLSDYPLIWHIIHLYGGFHQWGYQQMDGL